MECLRAKAITEECFFNISFYTPRFEYKNIPKSTGTVSTLPQAILAGMEKLACVTGSGHY
jgi:hypothetical protein